MNKKTNPNLYLIVYIVLSLILLVLAVRNFVIDSKMDCDKCQIELINQRANSNPYTFGVYSIPDLFEEYYKEGKCNITWDESGGYVNG